MQQNGHMITMAKYLIIDEHVHRTRGGLTMEMGIKKTALLSS